MKHHPYLQELVEQEYFTKTPVYCQDEGFIQSTLLNITHTMSAVSPIEFQGCIVEGIDAIHVTKPISVENANVATYIFPQEEELLITYFCDVREKTTIPFNAVLTMGFLRLGDEDLLPLPQKPHASFSCADEKIIKLTQRYSNHILKDLYNAAIIGVYQLASLELENNKPYI